MFNCLTSMSLGCLLLNEPSETTYCLLLERVLSLGVLNHVRQERHQHKKVQRNNIVNAMPTLQILGIVFALPSNICFSVILFALQELTRAHGHPHMHTKHGYGKSVRYYSKSKHERTRKAVQQSHLYKENVNIMLACVYTTQTVIATVVNRNTIIYGG